MFGRQVGHEVVDDSFLGAHASGSPVGFQIDDDRIGEARFLRQRSVDEPFHLRAPLPTDDEDGHLV
jgi:hypothetical protein